jgi:signal transduction histidine kinase
LAERSDVAITLDVADNIGRLPSDMELTIFRLVQECLTNIHRHSGSKTAFIRVAREGENVRAEVRDRGKGISPERLLEIQSHGSGVGIRGIRERIRQFHGEMRVESDGLGTSVIVSIPMPRETPSADSQPLQATV